MLISITLVIWLAHYAVATSNFTADELLHTTFPILISTDVDLDPCKADGFYGDIAVPNVQYDLELASQRLIKQPPPGWDEDFDIVEPEIHPYLEEPDTEKTAEKSSEKDEISWRQRLQEERNRRIQHTGDPATVEIKELIKKKVPTPRMVEMVKDSNNVDERGLEERIRHASDKEAKRKKKKGARRNDKRLRIPEEGEEVLPIADEVSNRIKAHLTENPRRRQKSQQNRRKRRKHRQKNKG